MTYRNSITIIIIVVQAQQNSGKVRYRGEKLTQSLIWVGITYQSQAQQNSGKVRYRGEKLTQSLIWVGIVPQECLDALSAGTEGFAAWCKIDNADGQLRVKNIPYGPGNSRLRGFDRDHARFLKSFVSQAGVERLLFEYTNGLYIPDGRGASQGGEVRGLCLYTPTRNYDDPEGMHDACRHLQIRAFLARLAARLQPFLPRLREASKAHSQSWIKKYGPVPQSAIGAHASDEVRAAELLYFAEAMIIATLRELQHDLMSWDAMVRMRRVAHFNVSDGESKKLKASRNQNLLNVTEPRVESALKFFDETALSDDELELLTADACGGEANASTNVIRVTALGHEYEDEEDGQDVDVQSEADTRASSVAMSDITTPSTVRQSRGSGRSKRPRISPGSSCEAASSDHPTDAVLQQLLRQQHDHVTLSEESRDRRQAEQQLFQMRMQQEQLTFQAEQQRKQLEFQVEQQERKLRFQAEHELAMARLKHEQTMQLSQLQMNYQRWRVERGEEALHQDAAPS
ncbi:uncharacterized protein MONBRDRAFT_5106 [Monosiga brevicollis MX1]|uniref:Uncharacterized protein n=1 Tax=Monosiga brevicollis TaxID=81824 RepID=A9UPY3_MONBE|nr:uncharacterized protein MONBRDRAFT_5106 [Monosiga brevicollis MX1]EDQ92954.1 predicted protein [Monosiga brevicollis MX1]|eukprot:XP_001742716.1 hypothetical protein [Monosiga brevicollis MX1]